MNYSENTALRLQPTESYTLAHTVHLSLDTMSDEQLAVAYSKGNDKAFELLLDRNKQKLLAYILFVTRNADIANDIFQDTVVKAIVKLQQGLYKPSGKFYCWLMRIAHNSIMDSFRRTRYANIVDVQDDNDMTKIDNDAVIVKSSEDCIANEQVFSDVESLMNQLPKNQRDVVFMRYYQQLSFKEIADLTGVSINTALGRMHYAVHNLRSMVQEHDIKLTLA